MGKGAGLEGVLLVSVPTIPVPLIKRGANQAGYPGKKLPAGPPSQGGGEWLEQALQDDPIPQGAGGGWGWVGGCSNLFFLLFLSQKTVSLKDI